MGRSLQLRGDILFSAHVSLLNTVVLTNIFLDKVNKRTIVLLEGEWIVLMKETVDLVIDAIAIYNLSG